MRSSRSMPRWGPRSRVSHEHNPLTSYSYTLSCSFTPRSIVLSHFVYQPTVAVAWSLHPNA